MARSRQFATRSGQPDGYWAVALAHRVARIVSNMLLCRALRRSRSSWRKRPGTSLLVEVIVRLSALKAATHIGEPGLYHETITYAFLLLINERMGDGRPHGSRYVLP